MSMCSCVGVIVVVVLNCLLLFCFVGFCVVMVVEDVLTYIHLSSNVLFQVSWLYYSVVARSHISIYAITKIHVCICV